MVAQDPYTVLVTGSNPVTPTTQQENQMSVEKIAEAMDTVEITRKEYDRLVKDSEWLSCLEAAGVDNWEGYDYALEMLHEDDDE